MELIFLATSECCINKSYSGVITSFYKNIQIRKFYHRGSINFDTSTVALPKGIVLLSDRPTPFYDGRMSFLSTCTETTLERFKKVEFFSSSIRQLLIFRQDSGCSLDSVCLSCFQSLMRWANMTESRSRK